jgi:thioredoxin reductase
MDARANETQYDVVVIGGGAAGLAAAVALVRARRTVLVVDAGEPRNAPAEGVHNYLTREGTPPGEILAAGRAELEAYGGTVLPRAATGIQREDGGFRVRLDDGTAIAGRRVLVATGLVDELPDVPGVAERWGSDVLHCPYCHGFEVRDQPLGVLGDGPMAVHQALMWRQWSDDVVLFLHRAPRPTDDEREQLAARGVRVVEGEVAALETSGGRMSGVRLASGELVPRAALVVAPRFTARADLVAPLGLAAEPVEVDGHVFGSRIPAGPMGATAVPGIWVAGNAADLQAKVISSAASGVDAGAAINADLIAEDVRLAVAAHRSMAA